MVRVAQIPRWKFAEQLSERGSFIIQTANANRYNSVSINTLPAPSKLQLVVVLVDTAAKTWIFSVFHTNLRGTHGEQIAVQYR